MIRRKNSYTKVPKMGGNFSRANAMRSYLGLGDEFGTVEMRGNREQNPQGAYARSVATLDPASMLPQPLPSATFSLAPGATTTQQQPAPTTTLASAAAALQQLLAPTQTAAPTGSTFTRVRRQQQ